MRDYGRVYNSFWSSQTIRELSEDGRMLALYLMTSPHTTSAGVFRLPDGYVCEDLGWSSQRVSKGFAELLRKGFANRCETSKWVFIVQHLKWNPPENPNQRKSMAKVVLSIPRECCWKPYFMRVWGEILGIDPADFGNPSETVTKPFRNTEPEPYTDTQPEPEKETEKDNPPLPPLRGEPCASPGGERVAALPRGHQHRFDRFWAAYPKKRSKGDAVKAWRKLKPDEPLLTRMLTALDRAKTSAEWRKDAGKFIPHPASWLHAEGWADEFGEPRDSALPEGFFDVEHIPEVSLASR